MVRTHIRNRQLTPPAYQYIKGLINDIPSIPVDYSTAAAQGSIPKQDQVSRIYGVSGIASNNPNIAPTSATMLTVPLGKRYTIAGFTHLMIGAVGGSFYGVGQINAGGTTLSYIQVPTQNPAAVSERDLFFPPEQEVTLYAGDTLVISITTGDTTQCVVYYRIFDQL